MLKGKLTGSMFCCMQFIGDIEQFCRRWQSHEIDGAHISKYVPNNQFGQRKLVNH